MEGGFERAAQRRERNLEVDDVIRSGMDADGLEDGLNGENITPTPGCPALG